jgi:hypothetical protein
MTLAARLHSARLLLPYLIPLSHLLSSSLPLVCDHSHLSTYLCSKEVSSSRAGVVIKGYLPTPSLQRAHPKSLAIPHCYSLPFTLVHCYRIVTPATMMLTVSPRSPRSPQRRFTMLESSTNTSSSANLLHPTPSNNGLRTRVRRSMSSGSFGLGENSGKELTAGQRKALEDKKGSRHADVIDTWDPTGLGSASKSATRPSSLHPSNHLTTYSVWHHAGPYDAAAPSRNQNLPPTKAPMQAFGERPVQAPLKQGPSMISLASPPVPPAKEVNPDAVPRRSHATAMKHGSTSRRVSGGGLTGQYSTSMPSSGGYFPDANAAPMDEATLARQERQRQREEKRRALKAAWGIDNRECCDQSV